MHILIINGPNLHNIGLREPNIYGNINFNEYLEELKLSFDGVTLEYFNSQSEGDIIEKMYRAEDTQLAGIIINAGAYSHYSIAIRDCISSLHLPVICIHISNIYSREKFRAKNLIAKDCAGVITGFGLNSYKLAINAILIIKDDGKKKNNIQA